MKRLSRIPTLIAFAFVYIVQTAGIQAEETNHTLSVTGLGKVAIAPDMAIVTASVVRQAETAKQALDANTAAMNKVLSALRKAGLEERDIQTSNFNIYPRYQHTKRNKNGVQEPPKIVGYEVTNGLTIRIRDIATTGEILDRIVSLGINSGGNIQFTNADPAMHLKKARTAAVKDAMAKAETIVAAAGVELGAIKSITENGSQPRPVPIRQMRAEALVADAATVPIAGGENEYRVQVHISWEIDQ